MIRQLIEHLNQFLCTSTMQQPGRLSPEFNPTVFKNQKHTLFLLNILLRPLRRDNRFWEFTSKLDLNQVYPNLSQLRQR